MKQGTLLVVDDEPGIIESLKWGLELESHTVHTATSGLQALQCLRDHPIDILITDLRMPGMDGLELLREAKGLRQELQIIMITAHGDIDSAIKALDGGASGYLLKPPNMQELEIHIERCLEKIELRRSLFQRTADLEAEVIMRRQTEQNLVHAKEYTDSILSSLIDILIVFSPDGVIEKVNRPDLLGYSENELIGTSIKLIFHESGFLDKTKLDALFQSGIILNTKTTLETKKGSLVSSLLSGTVLRKQKSGMVSFVLLARDITEHEKEQTKIKEQEALLIHAGRLTAMGEMASSISHEINQPLAIIRMWSQSLGKDIKRGTTNPESLLHTAEELMRQVDRATTIITHMRSFAARDRGTESNREPIDVTVPFRDAFLFFNEQFRLHSIAINIEIEESLPKVCIHANWFEQIMVNLLSNARYAVDERGENDPQYKKEIVVRLLQKKEQNALVLEVEDNGIGMTKEEQNRCLEPFFSTKKVGKGTGLGLHIIHGIVQEIKGTIHVESAINKGTKFQVFMPGERSS